VRKITLALEAADEDFHVIGDRVRSARRRDFPLRLGATLKGHSGIE
jgi:hypothetical protein